MISGTNQEVQRNPGVIEATILYWHDPSKIDWPDFLRSFTEVPFENLIIIHLSLHLNFRNMIARAAPYHDTRNPKCSKSQIVSN